MGINAVHETWFTRCLVGMVAWQCQSQDERCGCITVMAEYDYPKISAVKYWAGVCCSCFGFFQDGDARELGRISAGTRKLPRWRQTRSRGTRCPVLPHIAGSSLPRTIGTSENYIKLRNQQMAIANHVLQQLLQSVLPPDSKLHN